MALKSLHDFKEQYRFRCTDTWGDALDCWLEAAGHIHRRNLPVPLGWQYWPGLRGDGTETECYWYEQFDNAPDAMLFQIGVFMFRYCEHLNYHGINE